MSKEVKSTKSEKPSRRRGARPTMADLIAANRKSVFDGLRAAGVVQCEVRYEGSGDDGWPEETTFLGPGYKVIQLKPIPKVSRYEINKFYDPKVQAQWCKTAKPREFPLDEAAANFAMDAVEQNFDGWENNEGGYGQVIFNVEKDTVIVEHDDYYLETEHSEVSL